MANLINTNSAVAVRDAQKSGTLIHIEPTEVKNLKAGNRYELNGKELFIKSSYNSKKRTGSRTGYTIVWDGKESFCRDVTELQKLVTGKTAREAGYSQKSSTKNPANGFIPTSRKEAFAKADEWTRNAIAKAIEATAAIAKEVSLSDSERLVLLKIACRYKQAKEETLLQRYENAAAEKAAKAEEKKLKTVDGQRERAEKAEAELARARAILAELGVTL